MSYFKSGVVGLDKLNNRYFMAYVPADRYEWIEELRTISPWVYMRPHGPAASWTLRFNAQTSTLERGDFDAIVGATRGTQLQRGSPQQPGATVKTAGSTAIVPADNLTKSEAHPRGTSGKFIVVMVFLFASAGMWWLSRRTKAKPDQRGWGEKELRLSAVIMGVVALCAAVFALSDFSRKTGTQVGDPIIMGSPSTPLLRITSTGRLPIKLQGFQLGMSVADAIARDSSVENFNPNKGEPSPADIDATLVKTSSGGFFTILMFSKGRSEQINSTLKNIRAEDADAFDRATLNRLGKPDVDVYKGPSTRWWVWIDGDVRIMYNNVANTIGRTVEIQVAVYPYLIRCIETGTESDLIAKDVLLRQLKRDWGELNEPPVIKQLPHSLDGLQLGMTPWQVRQAVPGIDIASYSEHEAGGQVRATNLEIGVRFWDGTLMGVSSQQHDVPPQEFGKLRERLIADLGTPARDGHVRNLETLTWEDGRVEFVYQGQQTLDNHSWTAIILRDKEMYAISRADPRNTAQLKPAPMPRSFF